MTRKPSVSPLWSPITCGVHHFQRLNLDHPQITAHVLGDIEANIDVYYDRRWAITDRLCQFLLAEPLWVADQTVLVLGAGVGLETLVIGSLCTQLYINDLSDTALELCAWQLRQNGIEHYVCLPGRYEHLTLPAVDLIVGCFLVYNRNTLEAMRQLLTHRTPPILLANDNMPDFEKLVRETTRRVRFLLPADKAPCILLTW